MKSDRLGDIAIIIPVGPKDRSWQVLLSDLSTHLGSIADSVEVIFVGVGERPIDFDDRVQSLDFKCSVRWIVAQQGRAVQLNLGAQSTNKTFLWFLHADSRVEENALTALARVIHDEEDALYYFDLSFLTDGPRLMKINRIGVWIRSHWMGLPFGDQGFCLKRDLFECLGSFNEDAPYGEDHLLVWEAHHKGIRLRCTGASIQTSARRYREQGWGKATVKTMALTARQALPELVKLIRKRTTYG